MDNSYENYKILKKNYKDLKNALRGGGRERDAALASNALHNQYLKREAAEMRWKRQELGTTRILGNETCCRVKLGKIGYTNVQSLNNDKYTGTQTGNCEYGYTCTDKSGEVITNILKRDKKALCGTCQREISYIRQLENSRIERQDRREEEKERREEEKERRENEKKRREKDKK